MDGRRLDAGWAGADGRSRGGHHRGPAGSSRTPLAGPISSSCRSAPALLELLEAVAALRDVLAPGAVVTDVASTKAAIVERAAGLGLPFVGGHPMAGVTDRGFEASDEALFRDRPVICEGPTSPDGGYDRVATLARAWRRPVGMSPAEHHRAVASISHLPLVVAAALVETVVARKGAGDAHGSPGTARADWSAARDLAAGGWASSTRLARGDVAMATGIAITNGSVLAEKDRRARGDARGLAPGHRGRRRGRGLRPIRGCPAAAPRRRRGRVTSTVEAESVLVIPRARVPPPPWTGLRRDEAAVGELLATIAAEARFEPRASMEADPRFKQVIPYLILATDRAGSSCDGPRPAEMHGCTIAGPSASAATTIRATVTSSAGSGESGRRNSRPISSPTSSRWPADDDTTDVGSVHPGIVWRRRGGRTSRRDP